MRSGVVPAVDVGEDRVLGLVAGPPRVPVDEFDLQRGPEVLHQRVVVRVADGAHRGQDPVVLTSVPRSGKTCSSTRGRCGGSAGRRGRRGTRCRIRGRRGSGRCRSGRRSSSPTIRREKTSRTAASQNTPSPQGMRVASATHNRFGPSAVNCRLTRSGAGVCLRVLSGGAAAPASTQERALPALLAPSAARLRLRPTWMPSRRSCRVDPVRAVGAPGVSPRSRGCWTAARRSTTSRSHGARPA